VSSKIPITTTTNLSKEESDCTPTFDEFLTPLQWEAVEHLSDVLPCFAGLTNYVRIHTQFWRDFMVSEEPFQYLESNITRKGRTFYLMV